MRDKSCTYLWVKGQVFRMWLEITLIQKSGSNMFSKINDDPLAMGG